MLFKDYHIPMIRAGIKTVTRRDWKEGHNPPRQGSVHMAAATSMIPEGATYDSPMLMPKGDCTCFIRITEDPYQQPLGHMTDKDAQEEGLYSTVEDFKVGWEAINGLGSWQPDKEVWVVPFEYVGTRPLEGDARVANRFDPSHTGHITKAAAVCLGCGEMRTASGGAPWFGREKAPDAELSWSYPRDDVKFRCVHGCDTLQPQRIMVLERAPGVTS